jgi:tRNA threonylcarbamoyladenosine biosynthesis protein TsaE
MILSFTTHSSEETEVLAAGIGARMRGGECLELSSDLGGGKTTFTKGLLRGMGSQSVVNSPTFTISKQYDAPGNMTVHHFDFYRLQEPGLIIEELREVLTDSGAVTVIEWAQTVQDVLPSERLLIKFEKSPDSDTTRIITLHAPDSMSEQFKGLER